MSAADTAARVAICGSAKCQAPAVATAFWPGQTLHMCQPCIDRAKGVAAAMGFTLVVQPLGGAL